MRKSKIQLFLSIYSFLWISLNPFWLFAISPKPPSQITTHTTKHTFDQPINISTNSAAEITFDIQGLVGTVWDIDVQTFIEFADPRVLTITLQSPSGKKTVLMSNEGNAIDRNYDNPNSFVRGVNGKPPKNEPSPEIMPYPFEEDIKSLNANTNFFFGVLNGTLWDDQASKPVSQALYSINNNDYQASLAPEGSLDTFRGENPNGLWKLTIKSVEPAYAFKGVFRWKWSENFYIVDPNVDPFCEFFKSPNYVCDYIKAYYSWGTVPNDGCLYAFQFIEPNKMIDCDLDGFSDDFVTQAFKYKFDFLLFGSPHYKTFEEYNDPHNITNCSLIITTASGSHPIQWTSVSTHLNQAIANNSLINSILTVTNQGNNIKEIELFTDIDHNQPGDLIISLTSPSGKTALLSGNNGSNLDNVFANTFWDDQAITPATDAIYQNNIAKRSLVPEGALALFRGENPNGNWTLNIIDEEGNTNSSGKLDQWGLRLTSYVAPKNPLTIPPPPSAFNSMTLKTVAYTNYQPHNIQNFSTLIVPFQVTGLEGSIWDVDLTAFIQHPSTKDLLISLISPDGKKAVLSSGNGFQRGPFPENYFPQSFVLDYNEADPPNNVPPFPFDNFVLPSYNNLLNGISWNDQATLPITDADYSADLPLGSVTAEGALDIFRGIDPIGEWKLEIQDIRPNQSASGTSKWFNQSIPHMTSFITEGLITNCSLHLTVANGNSEIKDTGFTNVVNETLTDMPLADEISVSGVGSKLEQVKVYTKISHPQSGKLDLTLTSPSGKKVVLSTGNGGNAANIFQGTGWDDRASTDLRVTDVNFNNNQVEPLLVPEGALALFRGENPNGIWTLTVSDSQAAGTLEEWGLLITAYSVLLPPIVDYPPPPPPLPPPPYSLGNAYLFGQKSKTAYLLKQQNGALKEKPRAISELKAKHKIAAANYFSVSGSTNPMLCLILQYKNELTAKEVGTDGDFLNDAPLVISPLTERKDKVVASGDLNQDGYNDLVVQGKRRSVKILYGPDFPASSLPLTNNFRKLGKVVGVAGNRILSRKRNILYATALPTDTNDFVSPPEILANGLKASLKIRGVADISETPGLELIVQAGKRIGYGPLNLNSPFGYIYTNRSDLNMGKAVGPR